MSREAYPEPPPRAKAGVRSLSAAAERVLIAAVALLLLAPCFWQPHIIAGDLPSHLYNAWLAGQIEQGKVPGQGLSVAHPITNVLADWIMTKLLYSVGPTATERIVVGAAVEIFFWGAFFFVAAVARQRCWIMAPSLGMITYGLIFHLGFLNFYLSTGFSLWLLALLWSPRQPWVWLAIPCALLAQLANPLPLAWAVASLFYVYIVRRMPESLRPLGFLGGACILIAALTTMLSLLSTDWSLGILVGLDGILGLAGAGQIWIYGAKYLIVVAGLLLIWFGLLLARLDRGGFMEDPAVHLWGFSLLAYIMMPHAILFPQYLFPLEFMPFRLSLFIAIFFCAMVAGGPHGRSLTRASSILAGAYFTMLYVDAKSLNQVEQEVTRLVLRLPPESRVVTALADSGSPRLNGLIHVGSSACLGRCWDYGNYEPPTGQFRIRVAGPNGIVVDNMQKVAEIESGKHVVTSQEAPLYNFCPSKTGGAPFELRKLDAGQTTCLPGVAATNQF